jgi:hypothetical protein
MTKGYFVLVFTYSNENKTGLHFYLFISERDLKKTRQNICLSLSPDTACANIPAVPLQT